MEKVIFDFSHIRDFSEFYPIFAKRFSLGEEFGENLDALWDVVTGEIALPVEITFTHFTESKKRRFGALVLLFEEAEEELEGELRFNMVASSH